MQIKTTTSYYYTSDTNADRKPWWRHQMLVGVENGVATLQFRKSSEKQTHIPQPRDNINNHWVIHFEKVKIIWIIPQKK